MPPSRHLRGARARQLAALLALALAALLSGCGSSPSAARAVTALRTGMPVRHAAKSLDTALVTSTPDGGFYVDPTYLHFYYLRKVSLANVTPLLSGSERRDAGTLQGLGPLLEVVAVATNPGASTTAVDLTQAVLESQHTSKLVPAGVRSAVQQSYYQPIRPILVLSSYRLDVCSADVNPGATVWMLAVFPPVRSSAPLALVDPEFVQPAAHGFYVPVGRGGLPTSVPTTLYAQDVDHCIQILDQS